jgi:hypothetical protein
MSIGTTRANELFLRALELRSVRRASGAPRRARALGTAAFRAEVEALLEASDKAGVSPVSAPRPGARSIPRSCRARGTVIGPYKLLQQIGEGGMGVSGWRSKTQPVQRKVALKVIKPAWTAARSSPASRRNGKRWR